jgi:hypothetical protein
MPTTSKPMMAGKRPTNTANNFTPAGKNSRLMPAA